MDVRVRMREVPIIGARIVVETKNQSQSHRCWLAAAVATEARF